MRELIFILFFFASFTLVAEYDYESESGQDGYGTCSFYLNEDNTLCIRSTDVCLEPVGDTILADGSVSYFYCNNSSGCQGYPDHRWHYMRFPDGVDMLYPCRTQFYYPTGLKPGLYNFAEDFAEIIRINDDGTPVVEAKNKDSLQALNEKRYPTPPQPEPEPKEEIHDIPDDSSPQISSCTIQVRGKTIPLYGRVQVVNAFADFRVEVVPFSADLKVQAIDRMPMYCGEWQFVDSTPDFTIEYVPFSADLQIEFVDALPGMP